MQNNSKTAVVDNDFLMNIVSTRLPEDKIVEDCRTALEELGLLAIMHPLVYEKEAPQNDPVVKRLFYEKVMTKVEFEDIFQGSEDKQEYYFYLVDELYNSLRHQHFPFSGDAILREWRRSQSFGEIHSLSMCLLCEYGIFLSDDDDSQKLKNYIKRANLGKVVVYSRQEFFNKHQAEGITKIHRDDRHKLTHVRT